MATTLILGEFDTEAVARHWVTRAFRDDETQQREESRFPFLNAATICQDGVETRAMCRDLSKEGIGIIQRDDSPRIGIAMVSVLLQHQVVYLDVNLTWARELGNGWWASGGKLKAASINCATLLLLKMFRAIDRRIHKRFPFCQRFLVYTDFELSKRRFGIEGIRREAVSLDVSRGGIRLMCDQPLRIGKDFIYLQMSELAYGDTLIRGRVVSCQEFGNGCFVVGVQFAGN